MGGVAKTTARRNSPLRSAGGCSLGVALGPAEPYTPQAPVGEHGGGSVELGGACLGPGVKEASTKGVKTRR